MTYQSKKAPFAKMLPVLGAVLIAVGLGLLWILYEQDAPIPLLLVSPVAAIVGILFLWISLSTYYEITDGAVIAHSGPFWRTISREAITEIKPIRGVWYPSWGFALSLDVLLIRYRKKNGNPARLPVAVSPQDKEGFLRELGVQPTLQ